MLKYYQGLLEEVKEAKRSLLYEPVTTREALAFVEGERDSLTRLEKMLKAEDSRVTVYERMCDEFQTLTERIAQCPGGTYDFIRLISNALNLALVMNTVLSDVIAMRLRKKADLHKKEE